jgi:hypothetical protein
VINEPFLSHDRGYTYRQQGEFINLLLFVLSAEGDLREIGWGGINWIELAQDGDQWRALVNTVIKLGVP